MGEILASNGRFNLTVFRNGKLAVLKLCKPILLDKTGVKLLFVLDVVKIKGLVRGKLFHVVQNAIFHLR